MRRNNILATPIKNADYNFEDLYQDISHDWQRKAEALQIRRWRALKKELEGGL